MTVCLPKRDRCRLCFSLILRDRSTLFSSICGPKSYHLFKHIQRSKIPLKKASPFAINVPHRTVCFQELIARYLHTQIQPQKNCSNFICYDCSRILLDIEQCAKYLRKIRNQFKMKFNKSNQLMTSSLSATFQKKKQGLKFIEHQQIPMTNSDDDDQFDDIEDEEEKSDDEHDDTKALPSANRSKSLQFTFPTSSGGGGVSTNHPKNNTQCNDEEDDEEEEDEDDEGSTIQSTSKSHRRKQKNTVSNLHSSSSNISDPAGNFHDETNPHLRLRLAQMMTNAAAIAAAANSTSSTHPNHHHDENNADPMISAFTNMQRNLLMEFFNNPMVAAQAAAVAASTSPILNNLSPMSLLTSHSKHSGSGRKRKSTPEKRVITSHRSATNNGDTSPATEHDAIDTVNHQDAIDHPLELTIKGRQRSNRTPSAADVQNLAIKTKRTNGSPSNLGQFNPHTDEDYKESSTLNETSSSSLSPSLLRRSTPSKRQRLSTSGQLDYTNPSMVNLPPSTSDLLSPNHQQATSNDDPNRQRQQRKLDPRSCAECDKVLFSVKTHLLHCQTHAKNEKQCWICGAQDEDIKKHILSEHGNQKITNTGFKCQHCERVFPVFADLETHTKEHTKKKPFECSICHKRFGQQGNLSCHLRIHSGVKPFTCSSCGKAFRHSNSLRRHARTVHSATRSLTPTPTITGNSLLLSSSLSNDFKNEPLDDGPSALMIPSDDGSSSSGDPPSPSISNTQEEGDSYEQFGTN